MIGMKRQKPVKVAKLVKVTEKGRLLVEIELECGHRILRSVLPSANPLKQPYYVCHQCSGKYQQQGVWQDPVGQAFKELMQG